MTRQEKLWPVLTASYIHCIYKYIYLFIYFLKQHWPDLPAWPVGGADKLPATFDVVYFRIIRSSVCGGGGSCFYVCDIFLSATKRHSRVLIVSSAAVSYQDIYHHNDWGRTTVEVLSWLFIRSRSDAATRKGTGLGPTIYWNALR